MAESKVSGLIARLDKLNEYERQPITAEHYQGGRHFVGLFCGEHVAATEFVIGALFINKGAQTFDVIVGLLIGNLAAVLSWALICTPIAVKIRLTLYWYLRKIGGPVVMVVYNILNALMYCILAGAMITVSASAIRIPFGIEPQLGWLPTDIRFVFIVLGIGAVVVTLAIWGFKKLAQFAMICSPWMFLMFIVGALTMIPALLGSMGELKSICSFSDFWKLADARIWPGPQPGHVGEILGFWHIVSFAWIANLAMHLGLSDMALFRYARRGSYGFYSAFGMYLGHYLAWICAGIMGAGAAVLLNTTLPALDAGGVATTALGVSGALAVVIAGLTTSNPTIYRAGLALQVVTPNWPRWFVTLIAGAATTIVACSPFVFTKLLDFVGFYGLLLMPVGAIVVVEHWIFPRIGFRQYWVWRDGKYINWPAIIAWFATLIAAVIVVQRGILHLFFMIIPVWLCSAGLYIILCSLFGANKNNGNVPTDEADVAESPADIVQEKMPVRKKVTAWSYIAGLVAVSSLVVCLGMAIWVARSEGDDYNSRLEYFKSATIYLTVIYFMFGMVWIVQREKGRADGA